MEQLPEKEYIVVDYLPQQVPADNKGHFFSVEQVFLKEPRVSDLRGKFSDIILKFCWYYEIEVCNLSTNETRQNPKPVLLDECIRSNKCDLQILKKNLWLWLQRTIRTSPYIIQVIIWLNWSGFCKIWRIICLEAMSVRQSVNFRNTFLAL